MAGSRLFSAAFMSSVVFHQQATIHIQVNKNKKKKKELNYLTNEQRQRRHLFYLLSAHLRHTTLSVALRKAVTCCAGRQLDMPKHTSITSSDLVSNTFLNELLMTKSMELYWTFVTDKPPNHNIGYTEALCFN